MICDPSLSKIPHKIVQQLVCKIYSHNRNEMYDSRSSYLSFTCIVNINICIILFKVNDIDAILEPINSLITFECSLLRLLFFNV